MKSKNKALLLMGEVAAFGWFILRGISFLTLIPLPFLGWFYYKWSKKQKDIPLIFNGISLLFSVVIGSMLISHGLFQGGGFILLVALAFAAGLFAYEISKEELLLISRWWSIAFAAVFLLMLVGTIPELQWQKSMPSLEGWLEIGIFYFLAFFEPFSLGKDYAAAPLTLACFLFPFGFAAWFSLGSGAFEMAEYPYLSVWSGVAFFSIRHIEGIILGFYYGAVVLRGAEFFVNLKKIGCNERKKVVE